MKPIKYFLALWMFAALANCTATTTTTKEEKKPPIETVIEGLKSIQLPKF